MSSESSTRTSAVPRFVVRRARPPSATPSRAASAGCSRSAPPGSRLRQVGSRKIVLAVNDRRSPAERTNGYSGSLPGGSSQRGQLVQQLGDGQVDAAVLGAHPAPAVLVLVDGEHDAGRAGQDGVEQPLPELQALTVEAGPAHRVGERHGAAVGRTPEDGRRRGAVGQGRSEGAVEHDRGQRAERRVGGGGREEGLGELRPSLGRGRPQRREVVVGDATERLDEPGVDLRLGQDAVRAPGGPAGAGGTRCPGTRS